MSTNSPVTRHTFDDVMVPTYSPASIVPVRAAGSRVWDGEGREYIDLAGGIAVTALGHNHPELIAALHDQATRLWHISNVYTNEPALRIARRLTETTFAERVFLCNSGAEANEAALKLARRIAADNTVANASAAASGQAQAAPKDRIIAFKQAFHGRTLFTVTAGGQPKYTQGFGPLPQSIEHLPFNDMEAARAAIDDRTCAVIVEPVQGEGGVHPADAAFLALLRERCTAHGAVLIFDEVQIGMGRSGSLFAYMDYGVVPDILTSAKSLGNGIPVAALLTTAALAAHFSPGTHGSTYGGNPLACAVADKVLETINTPALLEGVRERSAYCLTALNAIKTRHGVFSDLRGMGLLLGAELSEPYKDRAKDFVEAALKHGLMLLNAGTNVLRFAPSLIIPYADLDEGFARLERAVTEIVGADAVPDLQSQKSATKATTETTA